MPINFEKKIIKFLEMIDVRQQVRNLKTVVVLYKKETINTNVNKKNPIK